MLVNECNITCWFTLFPNAISVDTPDLELVRDSGFEVTYNILPSVCVHVGDHSRHYGHGLGNICTKNKEKQLSW